MRIEEKWRELARQTNGVVHAREAYLEVKKGLFEIEHGGVLKHVEKYRLQLPSKYADKLVCLMDIESCGLPYSAPINTISLGSINGEFVVRTFFALDYTGEREILRKAWGIMRKADAVFSYNGDSFDMPRVLNRVKVHGIIPRGHKEPEKTFEGKHHDLYHTFKSMLEAKGQILTDKRLQTLEQILFHTHREHEIHGKDIGPAYKKFVYTSDSEAIEKMATIVDHNTLDVASLGACLEYLRQHGIEPLESIPQTEEHK